MNYEDIIKLGRDKLIQYIKGNNLKGIYLMDRGYDEPDKLIPLTD